MSVPARLSFVTLCARDVPRLAAFYRSLGWPEPVVTAVLAGRVRVGMTAAQVEAGWGAPLEVNRTTSARGRDEQWVYGERRYVYLTNGVVRTIQH